MENKDVRILSYHKVTDLKDGIDVNAPSKHPSCVFTPPVKPQPNPPKPITAYRRTLSLLGASCDGKAVNIYMQMKWRVFKIRTNLAKMIYRSELIPDFRNFKMAATSV
ncbi:MAG: hypothetical protein U9R53_11365 [Chloroflexota bacterium]|nr:hypothetical protein [Chloroflexota bacterium]